MNKIKRFLQKIAYALPFGMKGGDEEIMGGNTSVNSIGTTINQEVNDKRVAKHLLKGEVTQEVEELRYRTYKVANESEKYDYLGGGIAVKNDKEEAPRDLKKIKFSQENSLLCASVLDEMKRVNSYGQDKYRLEIVYNTTVRFKVEQFATQIDVNINDNEGLIETTLWFESLPNPYDMKSKPFINELARLMEAKGQREIERYDVASSIHDICFTTYKATNEDDFTNYCFVGGAKYQGIRLENGKYAVTYHWSEYMRVPLNLEAKYYSKSMAEKYKNKEKKEVSFDVAAAERKRYCSICGKEINTIDGDIMEYDGHQVVCKECLMKALKAKE